VEPAEAVPDETYRNKCPACGGTKVRVLIPDGENDNLFDPRNFRVFQDRQCKTCERVWTPACPRWAAYFCAAVGALLTSGAGAIVLFFVRENGAEGLLFGAMFGAIPGAGGCFALRYGIGALKGKLGRLRMR
jgi:hypothetical protein